MVTTRAAVLRRTGAPDHAGPMTIETLEAGPVTAGDVLVRVRAASLCHTDLEAIEGALSVNLPAVLGHEAAGEIFEVGADVTDLAVGDRVVLSWNPHCGRCFYFRRAAVVTVPDVSGQWAAGISFRWPAEAGLRRRAGASTDVPWRVFGILRGALAKRDPSAGRDAVRPRGVDRLRRDDRGRRGDANRSPGVG